MSQELRDTIEWLTSLRNTIEQGETELAIESINGAIAIAERTLAKDTAGTVIDFPAPPTQ